MADLTIDMQSDAWADLLPDADRRIAQSLEATLAHFAPAWQQAEVSVVLADDATVQDLNKTYRAQDKPTNVLSFPTGMVPDEERPLLLGDIVLAHQTIAREAAEQSKSFRDHATHLIVHGLLHLLGHDHGTEDQADLMEALEVSILAELDIGNPYTENQTVMEHVDG